MRDLIGRTLGHYRIVDKIGEGGMGEVYRAHDERLERDVAVKVLPAGIADDPERLGRFEREAKAIAKLDHPNILAIHDYGTQDGITYAVMELLEGESLRELIVRGGLTAGMAVEYARAIADGLSAAHDKGIVHRDLKPENVFLTKDSRIKILDFGLAKLAQPEVALTTETPTEKLYTRPGGLLGTVAYMAPEQLQAKPADHRSDIFALGVVLYEMMARRRPFGGGTTAEVAAGILEKDPEPIPDSVPTSLANVVSKCLAKRPEDRFSSAHDLSLTLGAIESSSREKSFVERRWPHIAAVVVATLIALFFVSLPGGLFERSADEPGQTEVPRIVVLPFENLGSPDDEYFADGMTEEIISRLSAVRELLVISRTSAMHYKSTDKAIRQIGDELNVQYVLEGTVRWERTGEGHGRVRITPQLINVADDTHIWSDRFDRAMESVFEVQSEIAEQVVRQLHINLRIPEKDALSARPTGSPEAYEAYLRGLENFSINDRGAAVLAEKLFGRAVELDPQFAGAWAALGDLHSWLYFVGFDRSLERRTAAKQAIEKALELDTGLPEGRLALGNYYYRDRDYRSALEEFDRVLAIRPNSTGALSGRAYVLRRQGRWEESTALFERVLEISPRDDQIAYSLSGNFSCLRDFRRAEEYADLAVSLAPDDPDGYGVLYTTFFRQGRLRDARTVYEEKPVTSPRGEIGWIRLEIAERRFEAALARVHETPETMYEQALGARAAGRRALDECACLFFLRDQAGIQEACGRALVTLEQRTREHPDNYYFLEALGLTYAYLGRKNDAIRVGQRAVALWPVAKDALVGPDLIEDLAAIYALVGEPDAAIDQIEYLLSIPCEVNVGWLRVHPWWDPLRDHPRFQELLEKYDNN